MFVTRKHVLLAFCACICSLGVTRPLLSQAAAPPTRYEASFESLQRHAVPQWYKDAKLGIFIHWGLYSVPARAPVYDAVFAFDDPQWPSHNPYAEWYRNTMQIPGSETAAYHKTHLRNG